MKALMWLLLPVYSVGIILGTLWCAVKTGFEDGFKMTDRFNKGEME